MPYYDPNAYSQTSYEAEMKRIQEEAKRAHRKGANNFLDEMRRLNAEKAALERQKYEHERSSQYQMRDPYTPLQPVVVRPGQEVTPAMQRQQAEYERQQEIQRRQREYEQRRLDPAFQQALLDRANGKGGPSPAELQLRQAQQAQTSQAYALANSSRGGFNPATQRLAMRQASDIGAQTAMQASVLRAQEQGQAQQTYGQYVLGQQGLSDTMSRGVMADVTHRDTGQLGAGMSLDDRRQAIDMAQKQMDAAKSEADRQFYANIIGGLMQAGGAVAGGAMMSDRRLKTAIRKPGKRDMDAFLSSLRPYTYRYRDESIGDGPRLGIMAQDLEKSKLGKTLVRETPIGKSVDVTAGFGAVLAAQAALNQRLKALEKGGD